MGKKCGCGLGSAFITIPLPSGKTLVTYLRITADQAKAWRAAAARAGTPKKVDAALELMDGYMRTHGVEAVRAPGAHVDRYYYDIVALYVNTGEPYDSTLIYDTEKERFTVGNWGDWVSAQERSWWYRFE